MSRLCPNALSRSLAYGVCFMQMSQSTKKKFASLDAFAISIDVYNFVRAVRFVVWIKAESHTFPLSCDMYMDSYELFSNE